MKSWLQDKNIEMYSTHNEGKSAGAERFFRTLKNKIYKYMTSITKMSLCEKCPNTELFLIHIFLYLD